PVAPATPQPDTLTSAPVATPATTVDSAAIANELFRKYGAMAAAATGSSETIRIRNQKFEISIDTKGGLISQVELLDGNKRYGSGQNIRLWSDSLKAMSMRFNLLGKGPVSFSDFYFEAPATEVNIQQANQDVALRMRTGNANETIELVYTFQPDSYEVGFKIRQVGLAGVVDFNSTPVDMEWVALGQANEKGISAERSRCSVYFKEKEEDRDYLSESSDDEETTESPVNWVAFKQDYFSAAVVSADGFQTGSNLKIVVSQDSAFTKLYGAKLKLPAAQNGQIALRYYFGPNEYSELKKMEVEDFDRIIDYGWSIIGVVNRWVVRPLFYFFQSFIGSWGLIILLVTLVIKTVLFPVTWKNFMSSAKMRVLKPEIDEINRKYEGKEAVEKQQATMALYRQTGVNPFAGCIPVLLQMPILYAMFRFFPAEIILRGKSFLWADDLAAYDSIFSWSQEIPVLSWIYGNHVSGFTILMCASTFLYSKMSMGAQPQMAQQPGMPNMTVMMNIFTVMMLFFFNNQPSGLALYYFIANMVSIGQMWAIRKYFINEDAIRAKMEENKKKPKTKSSFMQRLEEAQRQQKEKLAKGKR
ncbi:MAG: membrane protein insertase YidC, partial [Flavobacteriales bacterium]